MRVHSEAAIEPKFWTWTVTKTTAIRLYLAIHRILHAVMCYVKFAALSHIAMHADNLTLIYACQ